MQAHKHDLLTSDTRPVHRVEDDPFRLIKERFIGISQWAEEARGAIMLHAAHDNPIILEGEPGTGKEFMARLIHKCSGRSEAPFVAISCHNVSPESIEAALFGSTRMLSSGRKHVQRGVVESSDGGTLYINGVSNFTPALQEKIARLIQYREFNRSGSDSVEPVDVRIILGSTEVSQNGKSLLEADFIAVNDRMSIPALRHRLVDIEPLGRHFVRQFSNQLGREVRDIAPETIAHLCRYDWPGNVAELKSVMHHVIQQLIPPPIDPSLLPAHIMKTPEFTGTPQSIPEGGVDLCEEVKQMEISLLCAALKKCHGVQYKAAQLLGMKPTTFNTKIARYGIDVLAFK